MGGGFPAIDSLSDVEVGQSAAHTNRLRSKAHGFTLAEVLITLAIIGVVAALTLPTLITNINKKVVEHQKTVIDKRFDQGLRLYSTQDSAFNGQTYSDTEDFLNGLSKYFKMVKICGSDNIQDCIPYAQIKYDKSNGEDGTVDVSSLTTPEKLSLKSDEYYNPAAFVTAAGTPYIVALKKDCIIDPDSNDISPAACIAGLYDYNGSRVKNKFGDDIISMNGAKVGSSCIKEYGDVCVVAVFSQGAYKPLTKAECEAHKDELGISNSGYLDPCTDDNYWAGAAKACLDAGGKLPTEAQLATMANEIYGVSYTVADYKSRSSISFNPSKTQNIYDALRALGLKDQGGDHAPGFVLWSDAISPTCTSCSSRFSFSSDFTFLEYGSDMGFNFMQAVCVGK